MRYSDSRIPDDMVAEVLAEAARLQTEADKSYSLTDLQQICSEAQIPAHIVREAVRNIEAKRRQKQTKRWHLQQHLKRGISVGIMLLIPAIAVSSLFIFRSQFESLASGLVSLFDDSKPKVMLRDDFRNLVVGKTEQQVIEAVGKPDRITDHKVVQYWQYKAKIKDPVSENMSPATVLFYNGVVDSVNFNDY